VFHVCPVLTIHGKILQPFSFRQCLNLGKVSEYSCVAKILRPMMLVILLEDTIVVLC
jgi:hypothetical protein